MDKRLSCLYKLVPGLTSSDAVVIIIKVPDAKLLVEVSDFLDHGPTNEQAEPDKTIGLDTNSVVGFGSERRYSTVPSVERPMP
jgi:hypothetical protein